MCKFGLNLGLYTGRSWIDVRFLISYDFTTFEVETIKWYLPKTAKSMFSTILPLSRSKPSSGTSPKPQNRCFRRFFDPKPNNLLHISHLTGQSVSKLFHSWHNIFLNLFHLRKQRVIDVGLGIFQQSAYFIRVGGEVEGDSVHGLEHG